MTLSINKLKSTNQGLNEAELDALKGGVGWIGYLAGEAAKAVAEVMVANAHIGCETIKETVVKGDSTIVTTHHVCKP